MADENEIGVRVVAHNETASGLDGAKSNVEGFVESLNGVKEGVEGIFEKLPLIGEAMAAAFSVEKLMEFAEKFSEMGEEVLHVSQMLGMSAEDTSRLQHEFEVFGMSAESATVSLARLERNMAQAAATGKGPAAGAFDALGISVTNADGSVKSLTQILPEISDKFHEMADGTNKTADAMALFGRGGFRMIAFLNQGSEAMRELGDEVNKTGAVFTNSLAVAAEKTADQFHLFHMAVTGAGQAIYAQLQPSILMLMEGLNKLMVALVEFINTNSAARIVLKAFGDVLIAVGYVLYATVEVFNLIGDAFKMLTNVALAYSAPIKAAIIDVWQSTWIQNAVTWVTEGCKSIASDLRTLLSQAGEALVNIKNAIMDALGKVWDWVLDKVKSALSTLVGWLGHIPGFDDFAKSMKDKLGGAFDHVGNKSDTLKNTIQSGVDAMTKQMDKFGQGVQKFKQDAEKGLNLDKAEKDLEAGLPGAQAAIAGFTKTSSQNLASLGHQAQETWSAIMGQNAPSNQLGGPNLTPTQQPGLDPGKLLDPNAHPKKLTKNEWLQQLEEELRRAEIDDKVSYQNRAQFEIDFWQSKLSTVKTGSDQYYAIMEKLYPLLQAQQRKADDDGKAQAKKTLDERLAMAQLQAEGEIHISQQALEAKKKDLEAQVKTGQITQDQMYDQVKEATAKQATVQLQAYQRWAATEGMKPQKVAEINQKIVELNQKTTDQLREISDQQLEYDVQAQTRAIERQEAVDEKMMQVQAASRDKMTLMNLSKFQDELERETELKLKALDEEYNLNGQTLEAKQELYNKMLMVQLDYLSRYQQNEQQATQTTIQSWNSIASFITNPMDQMINGVLSGTQTMDQALQKFCQNMALYFIDAIAEMIVKLLVFQALIIATGQSEAMLGGAMFGGGGLLGGIGMLLAFDKGTTDVPHDMIAQIHEGEMIIPADIADHIRSGSGAGPSFDAGSFSQQAVAGGTNNLNVSLQVETMDANSFKSNINRFGRQLAQVVSTEMRNNPSLRPVF